MDLALITPLILTYNEAPNIERTLQKLTWAKQIVVVDSYSTDQTLEIIKQHPQVEVFRREFDTHATQWNYGLKQVNSEWVLSLDADYILNNKLIKEISDLDPVKQVDGYFIGFKYCVFGKPLRGSILPPRQALFRKNHATYIDDGHTQLLQVKKESDNLKNFIYHDDRKSLSRWLWAQDRYMIIEAQKITETPINQLSLGDKIRKQKILAPFIVFIYCLILKGVIFDGWQGWFYALQRMFAEILLALKLIEIDFEKSSSR